MQQNRARFSRCDFGEKRKRKLKLPRRQFLEIAGLGTVALAVPGTYDLLTRVTTDDGRATDPDHVPARAGWAGYGRLRVTVPA